MLLDTSGLLAVFNVNEAGHATAVALFEAPGPKLTHPHVLAELVALATARRLSRPAILAFIRTLLAHPEVEVVWAHEDLDLEALRLLENRPDKSWSLCDAVSFLLMQRRGITEALTTDHHFEQAGFVRLLQP